jgi:hypothetical protein
MARSFAGSEYTGDRNEEGKRIHGRSAMGLNNTSRTICSCGLFIV